MKYHALFVIFEKGAKFAIMVLQIIGGASRVRVCLSDAGLVSSRLYSNNGQISPVDDVPVVEGLPATSGRQRRC